MIRWKRGKKRGSSRQNKQLIPKQSITSKIINLLINPEPRIAFVKRYPNHSIYGLEVDVTLSNANSYDYSDVKTETYQHDKLENGLIPLPQAGQKYNIESEQLRDMCRKGLIEAHKARNRWIIKESSLRAFLKAAISAKVNKRRI